MQEFLPYYEEIKFAGHCCCAFGGVVLGRFFALRGVVGVGRAHGVRPLLLLCAFCRRRLVGISFCGNFPQRVFRMDFPRLACRLPSRSANAFGSQIENFRRFVGRVFAFAICAFGYNLLQYCKMKFEIKDFISKLVSFQSVSADSSKASQVAEWRRFFARSLNSVRLRQQK